jgi:hypothetical protein
VADPSYSTILNRLIEILKQTALFKHVGIDEQGGAGADQCPAVLVTLAGATYRPHELTGIGSSSTGTPYEIRLRWVLRCWDFSVEGPSDVVLKRLNLWNDVVTVLRNNYDIGGLVTTTDPTDVELPELDAGEAAIFGQAVLSFESLVRG